MYRSNAPGGANEEVNSNKDSYRNIDDHRHHQRPHQLHKHPHHYHQQQQQQQQHHKLISNDLSYRMSPPPPPPTAPPGVVQNHFYSQHQPHHHHQQMVHHSQSQHHVHQSPGSTNSSYPRVLLHCLPPGFPLKSLSPCNTLLFENVVVLFERIKLPSSSEEGSTKMNEGTKDDKVSAGGSSSITHDEGDKKDADTAFTKGEEATAGTSLKGRSRVIFGIQCVHCLNRPIGKLTKKKKKNDDGDYKFSKFFPKSVDCLFHTLGIMKVKHFSMANKNNNNKIKSSSSGDNVNDADDNRNRNKQQSSCCPFLPIVVKEHISDILATEQQQDLEGGDSSSSERTKYDDAVLEEACYAVAHTLGLKNLNKDDRVATAVTTTSIKADELLFEEHSDPSQGGIYVDDELQDQHRTFATARTPVRSSGFPTINNTTMDNDQSTMEGMVSGTTTTASGAPSIVTGTMSMKTQSKGTSALAFTPLNASHTNRQRRRFDISTNENDDGDAGNRSGAARGSGTSSNMSYFEMYPMKNTEGTTPKSFHNNNTQTPMGDTATPSVFASAPRHQHTGVAGQTTRTKVNKDTKMEQNVDQSLHPHPSPFFDSIVAGGPSPYSIHHHLTLTGNSKQASYYDPSPTSLSFPTPLSSYKQQYHHGSMIGTPLAGIEGEPSPSVGQLQLSSKDAGTSYPPFECDRQGGGGYSCPFCIRLPLHLRSVGYFSRDPPSLEFIVKHYTNCQDYNIHHRGGGGGTGTADGGTTANEGGPQPHSAPPGIVGPTGENGTTTIFPSPAQARYRRYGSSPGPGMGIGAGSSMFPPLPNIGRSDWQSPDRPDFQKEHQQEKDNMDRRGTSRGNERHTATVKGHRHDDKNDRDKRATNEKSAAANRGASGESINNTLSTLPPSVLHQPAASSNATRRPSPQDQYPHGTVPPPYPSPYHHPSPYNTTSAGALNSGRGGEYHQSHLHPSGPRGVDPSTSLTTPAPPFSHQYPPPSSHPSSLYPPPYPPHFASSRSDHFSDGRSGVPQRHFHDNRADYHHYSGRFGGSALQGIDGRHLYPPPSAQQQHDLHHHSSYAPGHHPRASPTPSPYFGGAGGGIPSAFPPYHGAPSYGNRDFPPSATSSSAHHHPAYPYPSSGSSHQHNHHPHHQRHTTPYDGVGGYPPPSYQQQHQHQHQQHPPPYSNYHRPHYPTPPPPNKGGGDGGGNKSPSKAFRGENASGGAGGRAIHPPVPPVLEGRAGSADVAPSKGGTKKAEQPNQASHPGETSSPGAEASSAAELPTEERLVQPEDKPLLTEYFYLLNQQLKPVRFREADRKSRGGKRKDIAIGFGGIACIHCDGKHGSRKFFWADVDRLANSFSEIPAHVLKCSSCPQMIKQQLLELKARHSQQMSNLPRGWQKIFFRRMWRRIHDHELLGDGTAAIATSSDGGGPEQENGTTTTDGNEQALTPGHEGTTPSRSASRGVGTSGGSNSGTRKAGGAGIMLVLPPTKHTLLSMPEDRQWLSDVDCQVRTWIEVFVINGSSSTDGDDDNYGTSTEALDIATALDVSEETFKPFQVGLRCVFCSNHHQDVQKLDVAQSVIECKKANAIQFPPSMDRIYESVRELQRLHFPKCPNVPQHLRKWVKFEKGTATSLSSILRRYYVISAKAHLLGMYDGDQNVGGGVFAANKSFHHDNSSSSYIQSPPPTSRQTTATKEESQTIKEQQQHHEQQQQKYQQNVSPVSRSKGKPLGQQNENKSTPKKRKGNIGTPTETGGPKHKPQNTSENINRRNNGSPKNQEDAATGTSSSPSSPSDKKRKSLRRPSTGDENMDDPQSPPTNKRISK